MRFAKLQGLGNDYLYVYGEVPGNIAELSRKLSDRHFGAGSDEMIYVSTSSIADFKMRIFNADGSEAKMCGNGIRCVGKYVYEKGYTDQTLLTVETLSGIKKLDLQIRAGKVKSVTVDMGTVTVGDDRKLASGGQTVIGTPVSVGNPHFVIFVEEIDKAPLDTLGPLIEKHEMFLEGTNVEFVQVQEWEQTYTNMMAARVPLSAHATRQIYVPERLYYWDCSMVPVSIVCFPIILLTRNRILTMKAKKKILIQPLHRRLAA